MSPAFVFGKVPSFKMGLVHLGTAGRRQWDKNCFFRNDANYVALPGCKALLCHSFHNYSQGLVVIEIQTPELIFSSFPDIQMWGYG